MSDTYYPPYAGWTKPSIVARVAILLAVGSVAAMLLGGLGTRLDWWHFRTGLNLLKYGAFAALAALPISILAALITRPGSNRRGLGLALIALAISVPAVVLPLRAYATVRAVPRIHDITTDWENPPQFVTVPALRSRGDNPLAYEGTIVADQQRAAYPDIRPLIVSAPADQVFKAAQQVIREEGWEIVDVDRGSGRIEAVDTTFLFGFKDDLVVRVSLVNEGTRVDVRSASRVGISDVGKNAERVRTFLRKLEAAL